MTAAPGALAERVRAAGAAVPGAWLARLLDPAGAARWLPRAGAPSATSGRPTTPQGWALLVFHGLLSSCGGRVASARGRALVFDLAARVVPLGVRGALSRPGASEAAQHAIWTRDELARARPGESAAACLLALEACGALAETPAMLEEARFRLGPGAEASDADALGALVADVVWRCGEDAGALLGGVAARAAGSASSP